MLTKPAQWHGCLSRGSRLTANHRNHQSSSHPSSSPRITFSMHSPSSKKKQEHNILRVFSQLFSCFLFETRADDVSCGLIHILTFSNDSQVHAPLIPFQLFSAALTRQWSNETPVSDRSDHADHDSSPERSISIRESCLLVHHSEQIISKRIRNTLT